MALTCERGEHGVGVGRELGELAVLTREDLDHLVGVAERRVGAVDHRVQIGASRRQAGAELVDDHAERLADRFLGNVLDDV